MMVFIRAESYRKWPIEFIFHFFIYHFDTNLMISIDISDTIFNVIQIINFRGYFFANIAVDLYFQMNI